jgi:hypothetical protein
MSRFETWALTVPNQLVGYTYDAAGNMTNDGFHTYTYDAEGNILEVDKGQTATYVYDALNHRGYSATSAGTNEYLFDPAGRRISTWNTATDAPTDGRIYWDNHQLAFRAADGHTYFDHQNWLGTERVRTDALGNTVLNRPSLPWGDGTTQVFGGTDQGQDTADFASLDIDTESNTQHAQFRNYSPTQGRWLTPDPYYGSYDITNPPSAAGGAAGGALLGCPAGGAAGVVAATPLIVTAGALGFVGDSGIEGAAALLTYQSDLQACQKL